MKHFEAKIREINYQEEQRGKYHHHLADAVILTQDDKLLLQFRPAWNERPPLLSAFGGHVEEGETIIQGLIRELKEELGADISSNEIIKIFTLTEDFTNHQDAIHVFFWHDKHGKIQGCFEHEACTFNTVNEAIIHSNIMDYLGYSLIRCKDLGYLT